MFPKISSLRDLWSQKDIPILLQDSNFWRVPWFPKLTQISTPKQAHQRDSKMCIPKHIRQYSQYKTKNPALAGFQITLNKRLG